MWGRVIAKMSIRVFAMAFFLPLIAAAHNPLLPRPQRVEYKAHSVRVSSLRIQLSLEASSEDRFAAAELARKLLQRTGIDVPTAVKNEVKKSVAGSETETSVLLERTGALDPLPTADEATGPDCREAYHLKISRSGITIRAPSSAGIFYGVQTLTQLVEGEGSAAVVPEAEIDDWPSLAYRGTMVDMSEGPLATEQEVERQIDLLSRLKANQYYFYNEDSIALDGYSLVNTGARFSKEQIRRIITYGRERHVDVVPCLELYGHQHDLFRIEKYSELADFAHGGEFDPANPKVRKLLADWVDQYAELFPSRFVHIGFDETWEIARAAKKAGPKATPAQLFLEQLDMVARRFQKQGKLVMVWADIVVKYPDIVGQLPKGVVAVPWYYEPDPDPEYKEWLNPLIAHKIPNLVAPGVSMWNEIAPDFSKSFRNIDTLLVAGKHAHTLGLINTMWSDDQMVLRRAGWPGMAYGAAAAWQSEPMDRTAFFSQYAAVLYRSEAAPLVASALDKLSSAELSLQKVWGPGTMLALWQNPFEHAVWNNLKAHREDLVQTRMLAEEAQEQLVSALAAGEDPTTLNSLLFASRLLDYAGMRSLYAVEIGDLWQKQKDHAGTDDDLWEMLGIAMSETHGRFGDIMDSLSELHPVYQENWLAEYTRYRLASALLRFDNEYHYWWRFQKRYTQFRETYRKGAPLPALEVLSGEY